MSEQLPGLPDFNTALPHELDIALQIVLGLIKVAAGLRGQSTPRFHFLAFDVLVDARHERVEFVFVVLPARLMLLPIIICTILVIDPRSLPLSLHWPLRVPFSLRIPPS